MIARKMSAESENLCELWLETEFSLHFKTEKPVPIPVVVESLRSIEKLLQRTRPFVEKATGGDVERIEVRVGEIKEGSLDKLLLVRYFFKDEASYQRAKARIDETVGENPMLNKIVALSAAVLIGTGVGMAISGSGDKTQPFQAYNNTILNIGAEANLSSGDIAAILDSVGDKKALARDSVRALSPARYGSDAGGLKISGIHELAMNKDLVSKIPEDYVSPSPDEKDEDYNNVGIEFLSNDQEKRKGQHAWAGKVGGLADTRVRFELSDSIDLTKIFAKKYAIADITITRKYNKARKRYEPSLVYLHNVRDR